MSEIDNEILNNEVGDNDHIPPYKPFKTTYCVIALFEETSLNSLYKSDYADQRRFEEYVDDRSEAIDLAKHFVGESAQVKLYECEFFKDNTYRYLEIIDWEYDGMSPREIINMMNDLRRLEEDDMPLVHSTGGSAPVASQVSGNINDSVPSMVPLRLHEMVNFYHGA